MVKKKNNVKTKQAESSKKIPVGVQIISVFYYICGVFCILLGLLVLIFAGGITSYFISQDPELLGVITVGVIVGLGILLALFGALTFLIARGLWRLKPWAKLLTIILSILIVIYAVYGMINQFGFMQIVNLAIGGATAIYLIISEEAKKAFK